MVDINFSLREPQDDREDNLATALAGSRMTDVTAHFTPRWWYQGTGNWTCQMRQKGRTVTGRGDYILISDRDDVTNAGVHEARLHTKHWMVLVVL